MLIIEFLEIHSLEIQVITSMERVSDKISVSVIVSVQNAEERVERCLRSVCGQSYPNIEILIVDAGSTDRSMEVAKQFAAQDSRVRILRSSSDNIYTAYNVGIDFGTGNFALFVDAMDYIDPDTVALCVERYLRHPAQIICFGYKVMGESGKIKQIVLPKIAMDFFRGETVQTEFLPRLVCIDPEKGISTRMTMTCHCAMFSLDLIHRNDWQFDTECSSDIVSLLTLYKDVNVVSVENRALYCFGQEDEPDICHKDFPTVRRNFEREVELCRQFGYSNKVEKALRYYFLLCVFDILSGIKHSDLPAKIRRQQMKFILEDTLLQKCVGQIEHDEMEKDLRLKFHKLEHKQRHVLKKVAKSMEQ